MHARTVIRTACVLVRSYAYTITHAWILTGNKSCRSFCPEGSSVPAACPAGRYSDAPGSVACLWCAAGKFSSGNSSACEPYVLHCSFAFCLFSALPPARRLDVLSGAVAETCSSSCCTCVRMYWNSSSSGVVEVLAAVVAVVIVVVVVVAYVVVAKSGSCNNSKKQQLQQREQQ
jgi:hypothetical protein